MFHSVEELELAISASPFPFEVGGVESLEVLGTWILFFLSRFSNSSILLISQWCSSWFGFLQYAQKSLSIFSLLPFLFEEEPLYWEEDCCVSDCVFCFHCFFLLLLFPPWLDLWSSVATKALVLDDLRSPKSTKWDCWTINMSANPSKEGFW